MRTDYTPNSYTHKDSLAERIERDLYEKVDIYRFTDLVGVVVIAGLLVWLMIGG